MCIAVDTTIIFFFWPSTIIAVARFVFLPPLSPLSIPSTVLFLFFSSRFLYRFLWWRVLSPLSVIQGDGTPLPLVFRNSLNKQAPIKVPRYIVHLEVGTISHGASANHFPSLPPPPLPPPPPLTPPPARFPSRSDDPSGSAAGVPNFSYPPTAPLKTICHRPRKYVLERNVRSTFFSRPRCYAPLTEIRVHAKR